MVLVTPIRRASAVFLPASATAGAHAAGPAPSVPLYQSDVALTDQNGRVFHLVDLRDESVLASMFYASCQMACPMIFGTIRVTLAKGGKPAHDGVRVPMVTVDLERDSAAALRKTASVHGTDDHWQVARANASGTCEAAVLLGVQYRRLVDGDFNHSGTILLLDAEGRTNARINTLGAADPKLANVICKLVATQC